MPGSTGNAQAAQVDQRPPGTFARCGCRRIDSAVSTPSATARQVETSASANSLIAPPLVGPSARRSSPSISILRPSWLSAVLVDRHRLVGDDRAHERDHAGRACAERAAGASRAPLTPEAAEVFRALPDAAAGVAAGSRASPDRAPGSLVGVEAVRGGSSQSAAGSGWLHLLLWPSVAVDGRCASAHRISRPPGMSPSSRRVENG